MPVSPSWAFLLLTSNIQFISRNSQAFLKEHLLIQQHLTSSSTSTPLPTSIFSLTLPWEPPKWVSSSPFLATSLLSVLSREVRMSLPDHKSDSITVQLKALPWLLITLRCPSLHPNHTGCLAVYRSQHTCSHSGTFHFLLPPFCNDFVQDRHKTLKCAFFTNLLKGSLL